MKKTIILIIIGVVTIGCIIYGTVYHMGGGFKNLRRAGFFITDDENGDGFSFNFENYDDEDVEKSSMNQALESFSKIKINSAIMKIRLEEGDNFTIQGTWNKAWMRPEVSVNNGTLEVKQKGKSHKNNGNNICRVTITFPRNTRFDDIEIDSNVGEIRFSNINSDNIDIDLNVGEINLRDVLFDNVSIDNNVGEVSVYTAANLDDYDISLSTDVGEVNVEGRSFKRSYNQHGNGNKKIKVKTDVGEINLK